jgi:sialidase-1
MKARKIAVGRTVSASRVRDGIAGPVDVCLCRGRVRIPAIEITTRGTLLMFYERRWERGDETRHDIWLKRSEDGGRTWGRVIPLTRDGRKLRKNYVNVSPVVDRDTGTIWAFYTWRQFDPVRLTQYVTRSDDDGRTWSTPSELRVEGGGLLFGYSDCSRGIQLASGRLLLPFSDVSDGWTPISVYSDDHGRSWHFGKGIAGDQWRCIETALVELADGRVHLNMRCSVPGTKHRLVALSHDGGVTWEKPVAHPAFRQPQIEGFGCHSSVTRLSDAKRHDRDRLLYSGHRGNARQDLTLFISYDEGRSWQPLRVIKNGSAGYSNLIVFPDLSIGCVYESFAPIKNEIRFSRFTLEWLTGGKDGIPPGGQRPPSGRTGSTAGCAR